MLIQISIKSQNLPIKPGMLMYQLGFNMLIFTKTGLEQHQLQS